MAYSALVSNALRLDLFKILNSVTFHAAADTPVSTADATDVASLVTLTNAIATRFNLHVPNLVDATTGAGLHGADSGHRVTSPAATSLATARTLLSEIETAIQAHAAATPAHFRPSLLGAPYTEMSGSVAEVCAHANALKVQLNAHLASALNSAVAT